MITITIWESRFTFHPPPPPPPFHRGGYSLMAWLIIKVSISWKCNGPSVTKVGVVLFKSHLKQKCRWLFSICAHMPIRYICTMSKIVCVLCPSHCVHYVHPTECIMSIPLCALCPSNWVHYVHPTVCIMSIPLCALCPSHCVHYVHPTECIMSIPLSALCPSQLCALCPFQWVHYVHPTVCIMSIPLSALCQSHCVHYDHPTVCIMSVSLCAGHDCEAVRNWEKENLQSTEYNIDHQNSAINTRWSVHPWQEMYAKNVSPLSYYILTHY